MVCERCPDTNNSSSLRNEREDDWKQRSYIEGEEIPDWEREEPLEKTTVEEVNTVIKKDSI